MERHTKKREIESKKIKSYDFFINTIKKIKKITYCTVPVFLKGFLSNSSSVKGNPVFGLIVGVVGFLGTPAP